MVRLQVTCIHKRGNHFDPHERIDAIGGLRSDGTRWYHPESFAIERIESGQTSYFVSVENRTVDVIVAKHNSRKYLKTRDDDYRLDNLLFLPECP